MTAPTPCSRCGSVPEAGVRFCRVCGAPVGTTDGTGLGSEVTVGPYRLVGVIGSGASGRVWLAHGEEGLPVAIKALAPYLVETAGFLERFRAEARVMASMSHPHVVRLYDYLENDDGAWVVMEFVEGSSLRAVEDHAAHLVPEQALGVLAGALSGLGYAHQLGLVHGDLKPENILVDTGGDSKLADFGQVVAAGSQEPTLGGTPTYMSPESARGSPLDRRSDLYSAGVILYEALAGRPPFVATNDLALLRMQVQDEPPPIAHLPASIDLLVRRSLAKDPGVRPQSAEDFVDELESAARSGLGADWVARASVAALVAATTATVTSLVGTGSALGGGATVGGTQLAGATTGAPGVPPAPTPTPPSVATAPGKTGIFHKLAGTKLGGFIGAHPIATVALSGVVVAGAAAGGVVAATNGAKGPQPVATTSTSTTGSQPAAWSTRPIPSGISDLSHVACPTERRCYAVGASGSTGSIIASSDGGTTWQSQSVPAGASPTNISCPSSSTCVAVGQSGPSGELAVGLVTHNGGRDWTTSTIPSDVGSLSDISCPSIDLCLAVGSANVQTGGTPTILRTSDSGATWTVITPPSGFGSSVDVVSCPIAAFCMIGGAGAGSSATSLPLTSVSVDGGQTWTTPVVVSNEPSGLEDLTCSNAQHCVGLDGSGGTNTLGTGTPYVSNDGGRTWAPGGSSVVGQSVSCSGTFCVSVGGAEILNPGAVASTAFVSTDGGESWTQQYLPQTPDLSGVACPALNDCIAVGGNGPTNTSGNPTILAYGGNVK